MRDETVARNYAETLFALAERHEGHEVFQEGMETLVRLLDENRDFRVFLETPRVAAAAKKDVVRKAFGDAFPRHLVNFVLITIDKRRQRLLRLIAREYDDLVDQHMGRAHVEITVARELDDATLGRVEESLSRLLGKTAIPHVRVKPEILGGLVVRAGDTIYDGSLRRRLDTMKKRLLGAELPSPEPGMPGSDTAGVGSGRGE